MNKKSWIRGAVILFLGSTSMLPATAVVTNPPLMVKYMDTYASQALKRYARANNVKPRMGSLEPNGQIEMSFKLTKGQKYGFATVCDANCSDIDIRLVDQDGQVIAEDIDNDNTASVVYTAEDNDVYDVQVIMPGCSNSECDYALGVYKRKP